MNLIKSRILVIEDEPSQVVLLRFNLTKAGFDVDVATDGEDGLLAAQESQPDLILLDWMLPSMPGVEVCRRLRRDKATRKTPIIMLTARSEERDKVRGLDVGADDYVTKPYSVKELIARVNAALRRIGGDFGGVLSAGKIEIDLEKHVVTCGEKRLTLSATEFRLLVTLIQTPDRVFSREQLLDMVWGVSSDIETRTVDVHVGRLRRRLSKAGEPDAIRTVRGFGYSFSADQGQD